MTGLADQLADGWNRAQGAGGRLRAVLTVVEQLDPEVDARAVAQAALQDDPRVVYGTLTAALLVGLALALRRVGALEDAFRYAPGDLTGAVELLVTPPLGHA